MTSETSSEPPQPSRFEKKTNMPSRPLGKTGFAGPTHGRRYSRASAARQSQRSAWTSGLLDMDVQGATTRYASELGPVWSEM